MAIKINNSTIIDDSRNIVNAGIVTATSFSGDGSGLTGVGVGASDSVNTTGIITASSFVGNLTGTASTATASATAYGLTGSPDVTVGVITATTISAGSSTGTPGQVLQSTGTGVEWATASGGISKSDSNLIGYDSSGARNDGANGRLDVFGTGNFQVFTSPGTYVVNPGISSIRVRVVGAGGNGASYTSPFTPPRPGGGGGGGGGYAHKVISSFTAPRTYTVTVGSAPGGTSSFGSEVSATGGSNGSNQTGGSGGTGSNGDVNYTGATGQSTGPSYPGYPGGNGGAAATQKGNGSGQSVPGLPSFSSSPLAAIRPSPAEAFIVNKIIDSRYISRFPFDIFIGAPGQTSVASQQPTTSAPIPIIKSGYSGGGGHSGRTSPNPYTGFSSGGDGGDGAGGGGGGRNTATPAAQPGGAGGIGGGGGGNGFKESGQPGGVGGSGGSGIVIVEW